MRPFDLLQFQMYLFRKREKTGYSADLLWRCPEVRSPVAEMCLKEAAFTKDLISILLFNNAVLIVI